MSYPVIVFFHGGNFQTGSANEWPAHGLASRGVIVVTVNYRVGALGEHLSILNHLLLWYMDPAIFERCLQNEEKNVAHILTSLYSLVREAISCAKNGKFFALSLKPQFE